MSSKKGPPKGTKVRQNADAKSLSPVMKFVTGGGMLEHMGILQKLKKDHLATITSEIKKLRKTMEFPPLPPLEEDGEAPILLNDGKAFVYPLARGVAMDSLGDEIVALRIYQKDRSPERIPVSEGKRWVEHNDNLILSRSKYREIGGEIVEMGKVYATRKLIGKDGKPKKDAQRRAEDKLDRKGSSPMLSVTLRLMPHEAKAVGDAGLVGDFTEAKLDSALDRTISAFENEVGCEVISVAVHRMRNSDLHIHIQFTMVLPVDRDEKLLKLAIKDWHTTAAQRARAALLSEKCSAGPAAVGKRIKEMVEKMEIDPKPTEVSGNFKTIYKKETGLRKLGNETILGYSLKYKLNLVRMIERALENSTADPEVLDDLVKLRDAVVSKYDRNNGFRYKAASSDELLEKMYLDLWLERQWRSNVVAELPEAAEKELLAAAINDARRYAEAGSTREVGQYYLDHQHHIDVARRLKEAEEAIKTTTEEIEKIERKIKEVEEAFNEESLRLEKLATRIEDDKTAVFGELQKAWRSLIEPEDLVEPVRESPEDQQGAEPALETTVSGWMTRIFDAFGKKEKAVEKAAEERGAATAWKWHIKNLGGKVPPGTETKMLESFAEAALKKRVTDFIANGISEGLELVFRFFGKEVPIGKRNAEIQKELLDANKEYESRLLLKTLRENLLLIQGEGTQDIEKLSVERLKEEIQTKAAKFREGVAAQTRVALEGLARHVFGGRIANHLIGSKKEEEELKSVIKDEFDRRGQAELKLEMAMPTIKERDGGLWEEARRIIDARPNPPQKPNKSQPQAPKPSGNDQEPKF
ncbi:MAG: hypothetical protein ABI600_12265 [Luteolibacter sp.]